MTHISLWHSVACSLSNSQSNSRMASEMATCMLKVTARENFFRQQTTSLVLCRDT